LMVLRYFRYMLLLRCDRFRSLFPEFPPVSVHNLSCL